VKTKNRKIQLDLNFFFKNNYLIVQRSLIYLVNYLMILSCFVLMNELMIEV